MFDETTNSAAEPAAQDVPPQAAAPVAELTTVAEDAPPLEPPAEPGPSDAEQKVASEDDLKPAVAVFGTDPKDIGSTPPSSDDLDKVAEESAIAEATAEPVAKLADLPAEVMAQLPEGTVVYEGDAVFHPQTGERLNPPQPSKVLVIAVRSSTLPHPMPVGNGVMQSVTVGQKLELPQEIIDKVNAEFVVQILLTPEFMASLEPAQLIAYRKGEPMHDPAAASVPINSDKFDSIGEAKEVVPLGPRGKNAPTDSLSEEQRARKAPAMPLGMASTDRVDSIGNAQDPEQEVPGPRSTTGYRPPDSFRS